MPNNLDIDDSCLESMVENFAKTMKSSNWESLYDEKITLHFLRHVLERLNWSKIANLSYRNKFSHNLIELPNVYEDAQLTIEQNKRIIQAMKNEISRSSTEQIKAYVAKSRGKTKKSLQNSLMLIKPSMTASLVDENRFIINNDPERNTLMGNIILIYAKNATDESYNFEIYIVIDYLRKEVVDLTGSTERKFIDLNCQNNIPVKIIYWTTDQDGNLKLIDHSKFNAYSNRLNDSSKKRRRVLKDIKGSIIMRDRFRYRRIENAELVEKLVDEKEFDSIAVEWVIQNLRVRLNERNSNKRICNVDIFRSENGKHQIIDLKKYDTDDQEPTLVMSAYAMTLGIPVKVHNIFNPLDEL